MMEINGSRNKIFQFDLHKVDLNHIYRWKLKQILFSNGNQNGKAV
jgi:hypothetical protein